MAGIAEPVEACCVARKWSGLTAVAPKQVRLNGVDEFGEGCGDPISRVDVGGEFVVSAAEVLDEMRVRY